MSWKGEVATKPKSKAGVASKLPEQLFEVDESSLTTSSSDTDDIKLQRWTLEQNETQNEFVPILPLVAEVSSPVPIQVVSAAHPYQERLGDEVAVEALELNFAFGMVEPFFCTMALYDAKEQRKISEDFHFQLNTPEQWAMVGVVPDVQLPAASCARKAVFRVSPTSKHADVYLFLTVSKVLSGELEETYETYSKSSASTWKEKDLKKFSTTLRDNCGRLSKYRQAFAWGAAPILEADGGSYKSEAIYSMELSRVKGDMWSLIEEVKEGKKIKAIPGMFRFVLTSKPETAGQFINRLTPSLAPVQPFDASNPERTKEVQEFTSTNEYPYPWVNYVNNYYLYLQKADLSSLSGRNIAIEVKFMDSDADPEAPGVRLIYADSLHQAIYVANHASSDSNSKVSTTSQSESTLVDAYTSTVQYHSQSPKLLDEIAIKLPTQVTDKHHLLISFYHVAVAVKKNDEIRTLVARTFVPLLKDHQIIRQKHIIRLASKLLPGYMTKEESVSWISDKKAALTIYARVISSVYPLEGALHKFLRSCEWDPKSDWTKIIAAMKGLFDEKTNRRQTVRYLPVVMRTLFQHLMSSSKALNKEAFETLLMILDSVSTLTKPEDGILEAYLTFVFNAEANLPKPGASHLYEKIIEQWMSVMNDKESPHAAATLKYSWFLVGVTLKSMSYTLVSTLAASSSSPDLPTSKSTRKVHASSTGDGASKKDSKNIKSEEVKSGGEKKLGGDWMRLFSNFMTACGSFVRENYKNAVCSTSLPTFHVQLARLIGDTLGWVSDRGAVYEVVWDFFNSLNLSNIDIFAYKCLMLKVWTQRPDFATLNIPVISGFRVSPVESTANHSSTSPSSDSVSTATQSSDIGSAASKVGNLASVRDIPRLFLQRHFFVGLMLKQVEYAYVTNNAMTRALVIDLVAEALCTHETDTRISTKQRSKIIQCYFPLILMVIDRFEILKQAPDAERAKTYAALVCILKHVSPSFLASYWRKEAERRIYTFFEILRAITDQFEWMGLEETSEFFKTNSFGPNPRLSPIALGVGQVDHDDVIITSDSRGALARQLSIGNRSPVISKDRKKKSSSKSSAALNAINRGSGQVEHSSSSSNLHSPTSGGSGVIESKSDSVVSPRSKKENGSASSADLVSPRIRSGSTAGQEKEEKSRKGSVSTTPSDSIVDASASHHTPTTSSVNIATRSSASRRVVRNANNTANQNRDLTLTANLSYQAGLVVLEVMNVFVTQFETALARRDVFEKAFEVLLHLFVPNQSVAFLSILHRKWYHWISKWGPRLFLKRNSVCGELVLAILSQCNSRVATTRSEAATVLAQIFNVNFNLAGNVDRSRLQATIAITKLVGQTASESFGRLFDSLAVVSKYFASQEKSIGEIVTQLEAKIRTIITDNLKIQKFKYDPETIVDLYYRISKQLLDHPDERITWLGNLAGYHKSMGQLEESAQTKILTAALVQQYLASLNRWDTDMVPVFELVLPAVHEETAEMPESSALATLKDEVCQSSVFSRQGFADLVREAIEMFKKAGLLELAVAAYRMLLPIYQTTEDYKMQQLCHGDLFTLTGQLNDETQMKQRIFSNYYRVTFCGTKLGTDLDGHTFIYRELNTMRLADFTTRLRVQLSNVYSSPSGDESNVIVIGNAQVLNRAELDLENKCYLQIASVEVFWGQEQNSEKSTAFKQHFGAKQFVMEQPFAKGSSGKAQTSSIEDQWLRRTIYTTERSFPFATKRLRVSHSEDQELSPIEYAEALIVKKSQQVRAELNVATPNLKTLQRELQGTLLTQVNAGVGAVIQTFLANEAADKYSEEMRERLAEATMDFDRALESAVKLNKRRMEPTADQTLLQEELEKGHTRFHTALHACSIIAEVQAKRRQKFAAKEQEQAERANKKLETKLDAPKKTKSGALELSPSAPSFASGNSSANLGRPSMRVVVKSATPPPQ